LNPGAAGGRRIASESVGSALLPGRASGSLGSVSAAAGGAGSWRGFAAALAGVLAWRLLLGLFLAWYLEASAFPMPPAGHYNYHGVEPVGGAFGQLLVKWDSYWLLDAAERGWRGADESNTPHRGAGEGESNAPHLPIYPLLMRALAATGLPAAVAGALVSNAAFVALLWLAWGYARERAGEGAAARLVVWLGVFPSGWVFHMVYSEAIFCAALFGFLLLHGRERYGAAALVGLALPLMRAPALALLLAVAGDLALEWRRTRRIERRKLLPLAGLLAGALGVGAFSWATTGSPVGFLAASAGWAVNEDYAGRWLPLVASLRDHRSEWAVLLPLPFLAVYTVAAAVLALRRPDVGSLFCAAAVLMLFQVSHLSQLRYLLPLLPVHLMLVRGLAEPVRFAPIAGLLAALQLLVTLLCLTWQLVP